ncbi:MAG TPA: bestrophin family ion channel [Chitinophagaceae bacterium]|nr:bestrophin family ion channel [Chitinophagaceae bacterium]
MITYDSKAWLKFIFLFSKSDTVRMLLPYLFAVALFTGAVAYFELEYFHLAETSYIKNLEEMHGILTVVISLLLVFRTNTAYDRWWEGRKMWGTLVNNSRSLAIKLNAMLADEEQKLFFNKTIALYASALAHHLASNITKFELDEKEHPELQTLDKDKHVPNQVAFMLFQRMNALYEQGKIKGDQLIILNAEVQSFTDVCGACERIRNTPIPLSYSSFLKKFIFTFVITLPFSFSFSLGYIAIPVVTFIFYVLASLEIIAEEIEEPFGFDSNDLPTFKIADNIRKNVDEIFENG